MFLLKYVNLEVSEEGLRRDLAESAASLSEWTDCLKKAGIAVTTMPGGKDFIMPSEDSFEGLWITDGSVRARELMERGIPVLGLIPSAPGGENTGGGFDGIAFLGYHLTEMEPEYLERIYRRQRGLPWEILETERCLVRETVPSDAKAFYEIYAEPSVTRFMEDLPKDEEEFDAWLEEYAKHVYGFLDYGIWTVCKKAQDVGSAGDRDAAEVVIGRAGLTVREGFEDPELGFVIGRKWQGMGYAKEVCGAILTYAGKLGIKRILAFAEEENEPSKQLLQRLGFALVGSQTIDGRRCLRFAAEMQVEAAETLLEKWRD